MTSSQFNRKDMSEEATKVENILNKDDFYSKIPDAEYKEISIFIRSTRSIFAELNNNKRSHAWNDAIGALIEINNRLIELKESHEKDVATHSNTPTIWILPDGTKHSLPIKPLILNLWKNIIIPALLEQSSYKKMHKEISNSSFGKKIADDEMKAYALIFTAIQAKYPQSKEWLNWKLDLEASVKSTSESGEAYDQGLIHHPKGISDEKQAATWAKKLNSLPGFENSVSIRTKNKAHFLVIHSPKELVKRLEAIKKDESKGDEKSNLPSSASSDQKSQGAQTGFAGFRQGFLNNHQTTPKDTGNTKTEPSPAKKA